MNSNAKTDQPLSGMRLGIAANTSWNILNFRMPIIQRLIRDGADVYVLSPPDESVEKIVASGATHLPITKLGRKGTAPIRDYQLMLELRQLYKDHKLDLVLQYTIKNVIYGSMASRPLRTKTISSITGLGYAFLNQKWIYLVASFLYRRSLKHCACVVFQNQDDRDLFVSRKFTSATKTKVIRGSGVDTEFFSTTRKLVSKGLQFIFVGRLLKDKGIQELLEATKQVAHSHPNVQFHFLGDVDLGNPASLTNAELEDWKQQPNLVFHGFQSDVKQFIAKSDVVILPSYREGLPRVLLEGMSMEKPCITTDVAGCRRTVDDGITGYVVKPKSSSELQNAILKMVSLSSDELQRMGIAGRKKVLDKFSIEIVVDRYSELIQEILFKRNT